MRSDRCRSTRRCRCRRSRWHECGEAFDAARVTFAEQVREGGEAASPEWRGEEKAEQDEGKAVAERVGNPSRKPFCVELAGSAYTGFGAEPGGEDGKGGEAKANAAAGDEVIGLRADPAGDEEADG